MIAELISKLKSQPIIEFSRLAQREIIELVQNYGADHEAGQSDGGGLNFRKFPCFGNRDDHYAHWKPHPKELELSQKIQPMQKKYSAVQWKEILLIKPWIETSLTTIFDKYDHCVLIPLDASTFPYKVVKKDNPELCVTLGADAFQGHSACNFVVSPAPYFRGFLIGQGRQKLKLQWQKQTFGSLFAVETFSEVTDQAVNKGLEAQRLQQDRRNLLLDYFSKVLRCKNFLGRCFHEDRMVEFWTSESDYRQFQKQYGEFLESLMLFLQSTESVLGIKFYRQQSVTHFQKLPDKEQNSILFRKFPLL